MQTVSLLSRLRFQNGGTRPAVIDAVRHGNTPAPAAGPGPDVNQACTNGATNAAASVQLSPVHTAPLLAQQSSLAARVLSDLVPHTLAPLITDFILPRLLLSASRGMPSDLNGELYASDSQQSYRLIAAADGSASVALEGEHNKIRIEVQPDAAGTSFETRLTDANGQRSTSISARQLVGAAAKRASTLDLGGGCEAWLSPHADAPAFFERSLVQPLQTAGPRILPVFPTGFFDGVGSETLKLTGYRVTNENSNDFEKFAIRGGAYLGIGSSQNYDHLTTARSELVFLTDADPRVVKDHEGILELVGHARDARHFLSMLMAVRLGDGDAQRPLPELFEHMLRQSKDKAYQEETLAGLPEDRRERVSRVINEARSALLPSWKTQLHKDHQHHWLTEPDRFAHLQSLQRSGRIVVRNADLAGDVVFSSIAASLDDWNKNHFPPITVNVVYLSNAEAWVSGGNSGGGKGYDALARNLQRLPLHPDGVILRTGAFPKLEQKGSWRYMTLPMRKYIIQAKAPHDKVKYDELNKAVNNPHHSLESQQSHPADEAAWHLLSRLRAAGRHVDAPHYALMEAMRDRMCTVQLPSGAVLHPPHLGALRDLTHLALGEKDRLPTADLDRYELLDRMRDHGVMFNDGGGNELQPFEARWALEDHAVHASFANGQPTLEIKNQDELSSLGELLGARPLAREQAERFLSNMERLRANGYRFKAANDDISDSSLHVRHALSNNKLRMHHADHPELVWLLRNESDFERVAVQERRDGSSPQQPLLDLLGQLEARGVTMGVSRQSLSTQRPAELLQWYPQAKMHLPHRVRWGLLFRRHVRARNAEQLAKLQSRLH
jgi:hypothetical protein